MKTPKSLVSLLGRVIDYAGLFPPASLDLDTSIRNFVSYRGEKRSWMLDTFVCPSGRLDELVRYGKLLRDNAPHRVSVLGPPTADLTQWRSGLRQVVRDVDQFQSRVEDIATAAAIELKMPRAVATDAGSLATAVSELSDLVEAIHDADVFVEVLPAAGPEIVSNVADALNRLQPGGRGRLGLKLRTGGVVPESIPKNDSVAAFICACRDSEIRFKATAGLHHPFFHYSTSVGADMHGFLNVFVGAMLAHTKHWTVDTLASFLELRNFSVSASDDSIGVGDDELTTAAIDRLRGEFIVSFGSCSFDEPWEDLVRLGLVE